MENSFQSTFDRMTAELDKAPDIVKPSEFWANLNKRHIERYRAFGLENFKRTLAKDYFTWMRVLPWDSQIRFLVRNSPLLHTVRAALGVFSPLKHRHIPFFEGVALNFLTRLVWQYVEREAPAEIAALSEPRIGGPPDIRIHGRLVSQDLANSILEYQSMQSAIGGTVCELGGGYGRNAFVISSLQSGVKYIMVDIPPALGVAQEYLGSVFADRRHFRFRDFKDFKEIEEDYNSSDFVFLLPHQMSLIPPGSINLFINISSLHEMRKDQIDHYLKVIFDLVRPGGHFYLKAWKTSVNPVDNIVIEEGDYALQLWHRVYCRTPKIQARFFEIMLQKPVGQSTPG